MNKNFNLSHLFENVSDYQYKHNSHLCQQLHDDEYAQTQSCHSSLLKRNIFQQTTVKQNESNVQNSEEETKRQQLIKEKEEKKERELIVEEILGLRKGFKVVLNCLLGLMNTYEKIQLSYKALAQKTGYSERDIRRATAMLKKLGLLHKDNAVGGSNRYFMAAEFYDEKLRADLGDILSSCLYAIKHDGYLSIPQKCPRYNKSINIYASSRIHVGETRHRWEYQDPCRVTYGDPYLLPSLRPEKRDAVVNSIDGNLEKGLEPLVDDSVWLAELQDGSFYSPVIQPVVHDTTPTTGWKEEVMYEYRSDNAPKVPKYITSIAELSLTTMQKNELAQFDESTIDYARDVLRKKGYVERPYPFFLKICQVSSAKRTMVSKTSPGQSKSIKSSIAKINATNQLCSENEKRRREVEASWDLPLTELADKKAAGLAHIKDPGMRAIMAELLDSCIKNAMKNKIETAQAGEQSLSDVKTVWQSGIDEVIDEAMFTEFDENTTILSSEVKASESTYEQVNTHLLFGD